MARKKGTVTKASKSKFSYYLQLDGEQMYFNTKFKPKCGEGDVVGIEFEQKGENRAQIKSVKIFEDNSGGYDASNSESSGGGFNKGGSKPSGGGGDRQDSICWQSSRKDAIEVIGELIGSGDLELKGDIDAKIATFKGLVDELTVEYFEAALDPRNSPAYKTVKDINDDLKDDAGGDDDSWDDDDDWS